MALLIGTADDDTLAGGSADDIFFGGGGSDSILGGPGKDTVFFTGNFNEYLITWSAEMRRYTVVDLVPGRDGTAVIGRVELFAFADGVKDWSNLVVGSGDGLVLAGTVLADTLRGGVGYDRLNGRDGDDRLEGLGADDTLIGGAGADMLDGGAGNDSLDGGSGDDTLRGGGGVDTAVFASGNDVSVSLLVTIAQDTGEGLDTLTGIENLASGGGDDHLIGNGLANRLAGGAGNDRLDGRFGADTLVGGAGDDTLNGGLGDDTLRGGEGTDTAVFASSNDVSVSLLVTSAQDTGEGRDTLIAIENVTSGGGDDHLIGNILANWLEGGAGNDTLDGRRGADTLLGGAGDDSLDGGAGDDRLLGGAGTDTAVFDFGADVTVNLSLTIAQRTGEGLDTLTGIENVTSGSGNDNLAGNHLANRLDGGAGNDTLEGGRGADTLLGGAGADRFVFASTLPNNVDRLLDFNAADDTIALDDAIFAALGGPLAESAFQSGAGSAALDSGVRIVFDTGTGDLWYDADGSGRIAGRQFAQVDLVGLSGTLTHEDFALF